MESSYIQRKSLPRHLIDCLIRFLGSVAFTVPSAYYLLQSGPRGTGHHDGEHAEKEDEIGGEGRDEKQEERAASQEEPSEAEPVSIFFYLSILKFHVFSLTGARENRLQSQSNKRTQSTTEELGAQDENQEGVSEAKTETLDIGDPNQIGLADGFARVGETVAPEQPKEEQLEKDE
jgi:hypothetical protein